MSRKTEFILILGILISFVFIGIGNSEELVCKKTIALSGGETVCDLSGEWNYDFVSRGENLTLPIGNFQDVIAISQQGNSFKGIRMSGGNYAPKGQVALEGKVGQNGIKELIHAANPLSTGSCKADLSKDGNKIEFQNTNFFVEMTRK